MSTVGIHAEVHAIAPAFMPRVMARVLEAISEEMARLMGCIDKFSQYGALQARLELAAIEEALTAYRNAGTRFAFQKLFYNVFSQGMYFTKVLEILQYTGKQCQS